MPTWFAAAPLIVAHRGASADAPENTLEAFALAVEQGADGVELDVQLAADGVPVVIHDDTVDRTTSGSGAVESFSSTELAALGVPALRDVFAGHGRALLYNVELKIMGPFTSRLAAAVAREIDAFGVEDAVLLSSFNPLALRAARKTCGRDLPLGLLHQAGWARHFHAFLDVSAVHPYYGLVDEPFMAWARRRDYRVNVWTVDEPNAAQRLYTLGVHAIITNRPRFLREQISL